MKVVLILILFVCLPPVTTATEENFTGEEDILDDEQKEGISLTEEDPEEDEDLDEVKVNQRNGVDAFEGDIMMTAEQWEEMKREFQRTRQPMP